MFSKRNFFSSTYEWVYILYQGALLSSRSYGRLLESEFLVNKRYTVPILWNSRVFLSFCIVLLEDIFGGTNNSLVDLFIAFGSLENLCSSYSSYNFFIRRILCLLYSQRSFQIFSSFVMKLFSLHCHMGNLFQRI